MRPRGTLLTTLLCCLAAASTVSFAGSGRCLRAEVPSPIVLPDGTIHPAGTLTLCVFDYSPVASYHRVSVNGKSVGLLFSQRRIAEGESRKEPFILFDRTRSGALRLVGYNLPDGREVHSYLLQDQPWTPRERNRITAANTGPPRFAK